MNPPQAVFHPEARDDLRRLSEDGPEQRTLQRRALGLIAQVARGEIRGKPCKARVDTGNLTDCQKLYFDVSEDVSPRYRIIYREKPRGIEVLAIGLKFQFRERSEQYIYRLVAARLGRAP